MRHVRMSLDASSSSNENSTALVSGDGTSLKPGLSKKVVVAAVLGNALEFYDFAAYAFFAVYIGQAFFPASTPFASLLLSLGAFGVGYVFRPLGGVLIGAFADRAGRRPAMLFTIVLITTGTGGLALTPSYSSIGLAAPVIVVLCRLVQGLAIGGEVGPASAFLIEIAPTDRRGLYGSWQLASQGLAGLARAVLTVVIARAGRPLPAPDDAGDAREAGSNCTVMGCSARPTGPAAGARRPHHPGWHRVDLCRRLHDHLRYRHVTPAAVDGAHSDCRRRVRHHRLCSPRRLDERHLWPAVYHPGATRTHGHRDRSIVPSAQRLSQRRQ